MQNIVEYIDHTFLSPLAVEKNIESLCAEAIHHNFKAVCINSKWVDLASFHLRDSSVMLATVVDFPFGANTLTSRLNQAETALLSGVQEIDLVAPLDRIEEEDWASLFKDIHKIRSLIGTRAFLKVIIEVSLFEAHPQKIIQASQICAQAGAHYIKTSTGIINSRPTNSEDIELIKKGLIDFPDVEIKASGGIKTLEQVIAFLNLGCMRIGTSSAVEIIKESSQLSKY